MLAYGARLAAAAMLVLFSFGTVSGWALSPAAERVGRDAYRAVKADRWGEALSLARSVGDPVAVKLVTWHRLVARKGGMTFRQISSFIDANPEWPWPDTMRRRAEAAIDESVPSSQLVSWFRRNPPRTGVGGMWYARALRATGDDSGAREAARQAWIDGSFDRTTEAQFTRSLGNYLTLDDHRRRLDTLLWAGNKTQAQRMLDRVDAGTRALAKARLDLRAQNPGVDAALQRVPSNLRNDPGLIYERIRWRRKNDLDDSARALLRGYRLDASAPERWWTERSILARRALADGYMSEAYRTASEHGNTDDGDYAEAEWLSGWIALRFLNEPSVARGHFEAMKRRVRFPISQARAAYWVGRTHAAQGQRDQENFWFRTAAAHPTTFYGQLAAVTLTPGRRPALPADPVPTGAERSAFRSHELTRAVVLLRSFGEARRLHPFILRLADTSDAPGWKALAAQLARDSGRADLGVFVGKQAYRTGNHLVDLAYPTLRLPPGGGRVDAPLTHGVIRQESAFRVDAVSPAGARGLMQLLPGTAQQMARKIGVPYSKGRLTTDPSYNVTLGRAYLGSMIERFDGSYILALAAYNAGPGRAKRWRAARGNPSASIEAAVDWIEAIPFSETRSYVQRALENLQVYRTKLGDSGATLDRDLIR